jgi:glutathione peroxidase-family protein
MRLGDATGHYNQPMYEWELKSWVHLETLKKQWQSSSFHPLEFPVEGHEVQKKKKQTCQLAGRCETN